jgi:hypothetical protein
MFIVADFHYVVSVIAWDVIRIIEPIRYDFMKISDDIFGYLSGIA